MAKKKKDKKLSYQLIERDSEAGRSMYSLLGELVSDHHSHLDDNRIALAWNFSWKPDPDGRLVLGKCKKATDLDRELIELDFVIVLLWQFWADESVTDEQRRALLDHELCHAAEKVDPETLDPVFDAKGRKVFRVRKHDVEEFAQIVRRHGLWMADLEVFARSLLASKQLSIPGALGDGTTVSVNGGPPATLGSPAAAEMIRKSVKHALDNQSTH